MPLHKNAWASDGDEVHLLQVPGQKLANWLSVQFTVEQAGGSGLPKHPTVGRLVGDTVGALDGVAVGENDGTSVGDFVQNLALQCPGQIAARGDEAQSAFSSPFDAGGNRLSHDDGSVAPLHSNREGGGVTRMQLPHVPGQSVENSGEEQSTDAQPLGSGIPLHPAEGAAVGAAVEGCTDGAAVGNPVGAADGTLVGAFVGAKVGKSVQNCDLQCPGHKRANGDVSQSGFSVPFGRSANKASHVGGSVNPLHTK